MESRIVEIYKEAGLLTKEEREILTSMLKISLRPTESSCNGNLQIVKGGYVLFSYILPCFGADAVIILATEGVFADTNIYTGNEVHLISPKWEVMGGSQLWMAGRNGAKHWTKATEGRNGDESGPTEWNKAHTPHGEEGKPGQNGRPGKPG